MPELNPGHTMHADKLEKASKFNAKDCIGQGRKYKDVPTDGVIARTKLLALIPSYTFLTLASAAPREGVGGTAIAVLKDDFVLF